MNFSTFKRLIEDYPIRSCDTAGYSKVIAELTDQFSGDNVLIESTPIPRFNFRGAMFIYLILAFSASMIGMRIPFAGMAGTVLIWIMATREFYHPLLAKFNTTNAQNLYFTIPARSKETQKLFLVATYATDEPFPKPNRLKDETYLIWLSMLFLTIPLINGLAYLTGERLYSYMTLLPCLAIIYWIGFNRKTQMRNSTFQDCASLAELKTLLLKTRPLSTSVTFALLGTRVMNSGVIHLSKKMKEGPKLTYVINLTKSSVENGQTISIVTTEGGFFVKRSDPTLIELLQMVAKEKKLMVTEKHLSEYTEIFPLLLKENKAVSIGKNLTKDSDSNRDLRELLAGLIRKLEH